MVICNETILWGPTLRLVPTGLPATGPVSEILRRPCRSRWFYWSDSGLEIRSRCTRFRSRRGFRSGGCWSIWCSRSPGPKARWWWWEHREKRPERLRRKRERWLFRWTDLWWESKLGWWRWRSEPDCRFSSCDPTNCKPRSKIFIDLN